MDNLAYPVAMAIAPALEYARAYDMITEALQATGGAARDSLVKCGVAVGVGAGVFVVLGGGGRWEG
jgi:hypothetical protein